MTARWVAAFAWLPSPACEHIDSHRGRGGRDHRRSSSFSLVANLAFHNGLIRRRRPCPPRAGPPERLDALDQPVQRRHVGPTRSQPGSPRCLPQLHVIELARTRSLATPWILISYARGRFGTCTCPLVCGAHPLSAVGSTRASPSDHLPQGGPGDTCLRGRPRSRSPVGSALETEDCMSLRSHSGVSVR